MRGLQSLIFSCFAVLLPLCVSGCGTVFNLFGYENTERALRGPNKGQVEVIPQAAIYGGFRQDISYGYTVEGGDFIRVLGYFYVWDLFLSFALDTLLLPITIPLNVGTSVPEHPRTFPSTVDP